MTPAFYFFNRRTVAFLAVLMVWVFNITLLANILGIMEYSPILTCSLIILSSLLYPAYIKSRPVDKTPIDKMVYYVTLISISIGTSILIIYFYVK